MTTAKDPTSAPAPAGVVELLAEDPTWLRLAGEVDLYAVEGAGPDLADRLRSVTVVDASAVTFIDSMGLHCLVTAAVASRERGERVRLLHPSPPVQQMLEITAMAEFFDVVD